jgi:hypothetical protein
MVEREARRETWQMVGLVAIFTALATGGWWLWGVVTRADDNSRSEAALVTTTAGGPCGGGGGRGGVPGVRRHAHRSLRPDPDDPRSPIGPPVRRHDIRS